MENLQKLEQESLEKEHKIKDLVLEELINLTMGRLGNTWTNIIMHPYSKFYFDEIDAILNKYGFNRKDFYLRILTFLSIKPEFLPMYCSQGMYIQGAERSNGKIVLHTVDGTFEALQLAEFLHDKQLLSSKSDMLNDCHEFTRFLAVTKNFDVAVSICNGLFTEKYIHAYNIDNEGLYYDGSRNLVFSEEMFRSLYNPDEELYRMSAQEFLKDPLYHENLSKECASLLIAEREFRKRF